VKVERGEIHMAFSMIQAGRIIGGIIMVIDISRKNMHPVSSGTMTMVKMDLTAF